MINKIQSQSILKLKILYIILTRYLILSFFEFTIDNCSYSDTIMNNKKTIDTEIKVRIELAENLVW